MTILATFVDYKTFTLVGDQTEQFHAKRRVKATGTGITYGTIASSNYTALTTVVLTEASEDLEVGLTQVHYGIVTADESSLPLHAHVDEGTGGYISYYSREEVNTISGTLRTDIDNNTVAINTNSYNISVVSGTVDSNTNLINTNTADITTNTYNITNVSGTVDGNTNDIITNTDNITLNTYNISVVSGTVDNNTTAIDVNVYNITNISGTVDNNTEAIELNAYDITVVSGTADTNTSNIVINSNNITTNAYNIGVVSGTVDDNTTAIALNTTHRGLTNNPHAVDADDVNCLAKDNTTSFTPDADYEPSTKKYVDDEITIVSGSIITDHGDLDGLGGDDHQMYFRSNGTRNMSGDIETNGNKVNINLPGDIVTIGLSTSTQIEVDATSINQSPIAGSLWHDVLAFNRVATPVYETYDGTTWSGGTLENTLFAHKERTGYTVISTTQSGCRWTWNDNAIAYNLAEWLVLGSSWTAVRPSVDVLFESSLDSVSWTTRHSSNLYGKSEPTWHKCDANENHPYARLTLIKNGANPTGEKKIASIRWLTPRWGNQGQGKEYEYPYDWDGDGNIVPLGTVDGRDIATDGSTLDAHVVNADAHHNELHTMTSTSDHSAGNWKLFASNGSGQVTEITNGTSNYILTSNGATSLPIWQAQPDHGELLGLSDDDHTQYSLVDGTRAFTGDVTMESDLSISGSITSVNNIDFNTTITGSPSHKEGRLFYDYSKKTLAMYNDRPDVSLQLGRELWSRSCNNSTSTIDDGKIVYISGVHISCPTIELAQPDEYDKSRIIGVTTETIASGTQGEVTAFGLVNGIDTSGLSTGPVYLAHDGALTSVAPIGAHFTVLVGNVLIVGVDDGVLYVNPSVSELTVEVTDTNGFANTTDTTMSFSDATPDRTFSITPTGTHFHYYIDGKSYHIGETDTVQLTNTEGLHIIYYNDGELTSLANPTNAQTDAVIRTKCTVAYVYWDATNLASSYFADERHGIGMSPQTHSYLHFTRGTQYMSGLGLGDFVISTGSDDEDAQFSMASGFIIDEDLHTASSDIDSTTGLPIYYLTGANGYLRRTTVSGFSVLDDVTAGVGATGRLVWNEYTGGAWQLTTVTNGGFVLCHAFAINGYEGTDQQIAIMGINEYSNAGLARAGATTEIATILTRLPNAEIIPIGTVIFQTRDNYGNDVKAKIVLTDEGDDYVDWRTTELAQGTTPSSHSNLTNLDNDDHLQYLLRTDFTVYSGTLQDEIDPNTTHRGLTNNPHAVDITDVSNLTTKGDLHTYTTTNVRLPVGVNNQFLVADSSEASGLKWTTASGTVSIGTPNSIAIYDGTEDIKSSTAIISDTGNMTIGGTLTVGEDDTGHDVTFYGATTGRYMLWDESANALKVQGAFDVFDGTNQVIVPGTGDFYGMSFGYGATAIGVLSLSMGGAAGSNYSGVLNTFIGYHAGGGIGGGASTGSGNMGLGANTLGKGTSGEDNVGVGNATLSDVTTGNKNIVVGGISGQDLTTGSFNIIIGANLEVISSSGSYQLNIAEVIKGNWEAGSEELIFPYKASILADNTNINFGAGRDTGINFDSTKLVIDTEGVGTLISGSVGIKGDTTFEGKVGIGTNSPDANLHITSDTTSPNIYVTVTGTSTIPALWFANNYSSVANYGGIGLYSDNSLRLSATGSFSNAPIIINPDGKIAFGGTAIGTEDFRFNGDTLWLGSQDDTIDNPQFYFGRGTDNQEFGYLMYDYNGAAADSFVRLGVVGGGSIHITADSFVGIGTTDPEGTLHVHTSSAGSVTANGGADNLIVEAADSAGISILTADDEYSSVLFGSPSDAIGAQIRWHHDEDLMRVGTGKTGAELSLGYGLNAEGMRIDGAGNVGIGTNSPLHELHVKHGGGDIDFKLETDSGVATIYLDGGHNQYYGYHIQNGGTDLWNIGNAGGTSQSLNFISPTTTVLTMYPGGNVSIGAADPAAGAKLHVAGAEGDANSGSSTLIIGNINNTTPAKRGTGVALIATNPTTSGGEDSSAIYFGHRSDDNAGEGSFSIIKSYKITGTDTSDLRFNYGTGSGGANAEAMRIDASGNIGIGTDSPDTKLDVNGAITSRALSSDPSDPDNDSHVTWQSDGTGSGDDGDIMMKITNGSGVTKTTTLIDFSAM